jgi:cytochrome c oxidase assembly factor CtaG
MAAHIRPWLAAAGAALIVAGLAVEGLARKYVVAESVQFVVFGIAAPALIVLGAPWRLLRLSRTPADPAPPATHGQASPGQASPGQASPGPGGRPGALDRLATARRRQTSFLRAGGYLMVFIGVSVAWRLPPVMDALARHPVLVLPELLTLLAAGTGLWLELVPSPPLAPRLPKPHRAAVAALAMWSTWAVAYVLGLSNHGVFHGYDPAGGALSAVADQEITVALVWAVSAFCFVPVVFVTLLTWLSGNGDPDEELQRLARDERQRPVVRGWGRPARGQAGLLTARFLASRARGDE